MSTARFSRVLAASLLLGICFSSSGGCGGPTDKPPGPSTPVGPGPDAPPVDEPASPSQATTPAPPKPPTPAEMKLPPASTVDNQVRKNVALLAAPNGSGGWVIAEQPMAELESLGPDSVEIIRPLLRDEDDAVRRGAAFYLFEYFDPSDPAVVAAFIDALGDDDSTIRHIALQAVKRLPAEKMAQSATQLTGLLDSEREQETHRAEVARLLARMGADALPALPQLESAAAKDPNERVRLACLYAISKIAPPNKAVAAHRLALSNDDSDKVKRVAAQKLAGLQGGVAASDELVGLLAHKDDELAAEAADTLVSFGVDASPALIKGLQSTDVRQRKLSLYCLGRIPPTPAGIAAIKQRAADPQEDAAVKNLANQALQNWKQAE